MKRNVTFDWLRIALIMGILMYETCANPNIIENSSFEVPLGTRWGQLGSNHTQGPLSGSWPAQWQTTGNETFQPHDNTTAHSGTHCLKLSCYGPLYMTMRSKIYRLKPNTDYTIRFAAKAEHVSSWGRMSLNNSFSAFFPDDASSFHKPLTTSWELYSFQHRTVSDPDRCSYQLTWQRTDGSSFNYFDDFELIETRLLDKYRPASDLEVGVAFDSPDRIFLLPTTPVAHVTVWNSTRVEQETTVRWETYDFWNTIRKSGALTLSVPGESRSTSLISLLDQGLTGSFRLVVWLDGTDKTQDEYAFSVLYPSPRLTADTGAILGLDLPFKQYFLETAQKAGVKWLRTLSTGCKPFRWKIAETENNSFKFFDDELQLAIDHGFTILASFGEELAHTPQWARTAPEVPSLVVLSEWQDFVQTMVSHYKSKVQYWEIWNEPDTEGGLGSYPEHYAELLSIAYSEIKTIDPSATVVGFAAVGSKYVANTIASLGSAKPWDIFSHHFYPGATGSLMDIFRTSIWIPEGKEAWNTESGAIHKTPYQTILWEDQYNSSTSAPSGSEYRQRANAVLRNFFITIGGGCAKYFYYDGRNTGGHDFYNSYSVFDFDHTLRPHGAALSIWANQLRDRPGVGSISLFPGVLGFKFSGSSGSAIALWAENVNAVFECANITATFRDLMGNVIPGPVTFGQEPIILWSSEPIEQLVEATSITEGKDTNAPSLSFVTWPLGTVDGNRVDFRMWAVDDVTYTQSVPPYDKPALLFSHKLDGIDEDWTAEDNAGLGTRGMWAVYRDLPSGNYIFRARVKDAAGNVSEKTLKFHVSKNAIMPPTRLRLR